MTSPEKRKGDRAERDLVEWLHANGYPEARRTRAGWDDDRGDINLGANGWGQFVEVKNRHQLAINGWLDQMDVKMQDLPDFDDAVLIVKRPGLADPGSWWAIRRVRDEFGIER